MSEPTLTYTDLAIAFCKTFEVSEAVLLNGKRTHDLTHVRRALWACLRELDWTYGEIGRRCGRDHSTVIHGIDRYHVTAHEPEFLAKVEQAKALAPEIATQRAAGVRFDVLSSLPPKKEKRPRGRKYGAAIALPKRAPTIKHDDGERNYEQQMRAHVQHASGLLFEALRQELAS